MRFRLPKLKLKPPKARPPAGAGGPRMGPGGPRPPRPPRPPRAPRSTTPRPPRPPRRPKPPLSPKVKRAAIASAAVAAVLLTALVVAIDLSSQPFACAKCHGPQADALHSSAHDGVTCYRCHLPAGMWSFPAAKADEWFRMYPAAIVGRKLSGPGPRISRTACASCHEKVLVGGKTKVHGLVIVHWQCAGEPTPCDACHTSVAHGRAVRWAREPVMDDCVVCHLERRASLKCDACHTGKLETDRIKTGPWQVTHGRNWERTHGIGDLQTCVTCHPPQKCVTCHRTRIPHSGNFSAEHGREAVLPESRCSTCHDVKGWCRDCHGVDMPHPKAFLKQHPTIARDARDPVCLKCHTDFDCANCHVRHAHPGATDGNLQGILPQVPQGGAE